MVAKALGTLRPVRGRLQSVTGTVANWGRNERWTPALIAEPTTTGQVAEHVARAAASGERVKVIGGGHSFTAAAATSGMQLTLDAMTDIVDADVTAGCVTVQAGIRLHQLNERLAGMGLALPNLGDIDRQSIAGAIATATHGTGRGLGNLATNVVGMTLVDGVGDVVRCSADEHADLLAVARVGIGALGVVTEVTLQCVPAFNLHARETIEPLDDVLADFDRASTDVDHFEFYWMPGTRRCQVKRNRRTDEPARPPGRLAYVRDKWLAENIGLGLVCRTGRALPALAPRIARLVMSSATERDLIDRSDRVFCSPRHVRFVEMEYAIPIAAVPEAVRRVRRLTERLSTRPLFPIEVRVSAGDDIALSMASDRTSGWIAVHQYRGVPYLEYFQGVEAIMDDYEGRPHWGKLHFQRAETLAKRYPRWDEFAAARARLDPNGTFRNDYLDRVLGWSETDAPGASAAAS
ncbi:D-arabinono-1,4-lactone oxidase [soil metagenome]